MKKISRRDLMKIAVGGAGLAFAGSRSSLLASPLPPAAHSSRFGGIQIGCMTWSLRDRPLGQALHDIAQMGFSSVELWSGHLDPFKSTDSEIKGWKKRFDDAGVKITSYFVDFGGQPVAEHIRRNFQAGRLLGVDVLSSNVPRSLIPEVDKQCQQFKMYVGLHNEVYGRPEPNQVQFPSDYVAVFRTSSRWIGATLDVGHLYAAGYSPVEFIRRHHARIVSIHLKNENRVLPHYTDFPFAKGPTPLIPTLHELQAVHFRRAANIEWAVQNMDPIKGISEALAYVRQALA